MSKVEKLAEIFKSLSDPTRLKLLNLLVKHKNPLCVNALAAKLNVTQSAVSQHLRILKQTGMVKGEKRGYFVHYEVDLTVIKTHNDLFHELFE